jgi:hypothetical protein
MCGSSTSSLEYAPRRPVAITGPASGPTGGASPGDGTGGASGAPRPGGPGPTAFARNLRVPMPLGRKVRLVMRNIAIKVKTRQGCCGHPGEPGC